MTASEALQDAATQLKEVCKHMKETFLKEVEDFEPSSDMEQ